MTHPPNHITPMRVLAVDPGYDRLGVAVMDKSSLHGDLLFSTCISTDKTTPFIERIRLIGTQLDAIFTHYAPTAVALEKLFFNSNQRTALQVAEVRGIVLYLASLRTCRILEYTPQEIKVAVTGYGKSDKRQVTTMVQRLLPGAKKNALDDEYDAIAVALTALASAR